MKRFNWWLNNRLAPIAKYAPGIEKCSLFTPIPNPRGGFDYRGTTTAEMRTHKPHDITETEWEMFIIRISNLVGGIAKSGSDQVATTLAELWAWSGLYNEGIKVFTPTATEIEALMRVDPNDNPDDFRHPFDTFAIAFPDDFMTGNLSEDFGSPAGAIARLDPKSRCYVLSIVSTGEVGITSNVVISNPGSYFERKSLMKWDDCDEKETDFATNCRTMALNTAMLLTRYGLRAIGPANPDRAAKLREKLAGKLPDSARRSNERELRMMPMIYGFSQQIKIYEDKRGESPTPGNGETRLTPHWRRGHWVNQPCGAGSKDRKVIFRPAVLVNDHLFGGKLSDTRVTMTTK